MATTRSTRGKSTKAKSGETQSERVAGPTKETQTEEVVADAPAASDPKENIENATEANSEEVVEAPGDSTGQAVQILVGGFYSGGSVYSKGQTAYLSTVHSEEDQRKIYGKVYYQKI